MRSGCGSGSVCGCGKRVQVQIVGGEGNVEGEGGAK